MSDLVSIPRHIVEEAHAAVLFAAVTQPHWLDVWRALDAYLNPPDPPTQEEPTP